METRSKWGRVFDAAWAAALGAALVLGADALLSRGHASASAPTLEAPRVPSRRAPTIDDPPSAPPRAAERKAAPEDAADERGTERYGVTFWNVHTRELLPVAAPPLPDPEDAPREDATTAERPSLAPPSPDTLAHFLRCRVTGDEAPMAPRPVEVALAMATRFGAERIHVISGFRSPKFNELLRKKGRQVARRSRHTMAQALDFQVPGVGARELAAAVEEIHEGGIGTYRVSGFVHVDVGPDRRWRGR
ncbi:MAG TPA: DUF882 domain-containing protein [Polyangiaceae bacterium LLY-WYZ-15_(1-7)]|nr:hypothetical protein [Myxococcales bacterium]HJK94782.1 DUF882 domain-containing protein [Polyangiaceae bacterium LLY-WYZ-15_(1-7)]HJL00010.1 DUF882 domain-containing protein [Polyangiaceae bacterium LLY-WYZ-15_(1-7)]HJL12459.1 DUF882 domain-containing protein [Polyangiaceae bacterium LLY-WYZ-15_(1-7)]HJL22223.1 DUF882 domain-containing protein [Polyangiaceae bacterium LLY-WYZ-15_(1-7)]